MNLLRTVKKLEIGSTVKSFFARWKIEGKDVNSTVDVLFPVGCVGISSQSKSWITKFQAENYSILVSNYQDIISKFSLKDGDYFYGKDNNYILVQGDNISIKTKQLNIESENININVTNGINLNGVQITISGNKILFNSKEVAVVGGDISTVTNKITTSGQ